MTSTIPCIDHQRTQCLDAVQSRHANKTTTPQKSAPHRKETSAPSPFTDGWAAPTHYPRPYTASMHARIYPVANACPTRASPSSPGICGV